MEEILNCRQVSKTWYSARSETEALRDVSFTLHSGEFVSIVGPSGDGKSTLIRLIAGLDGTTAGKIHFRESEITGIWKNCGVVFQQPRLFDYYSIFANVAFPLRIQSVPKDIRRERVMSLLGRMNLADFADRYPHELSLGMQQRVAFARATLLDPEVLLLDEPFASLDAQTRFLMQDFLLTYWLEQKTTTLLVTHSVDEALLLSDRIITLTARPGRVKSVINVQLPRPRNPYEESFIEIKKSLEYSIREEVLASWHNDYQP